MKKARNNFIRYTSIASILSSIILITNYALVGKTHSIQDGYNGIDLAIGLIGFTFTILVLTILNFIFSKPDPSKLQHRLLPVLILFITFITFIIIKIVAI